MPKYYINPDLLKIIAERRRRNMNTEKRFNEIDKRISILEYLKKNRKGQIDPRIILLIILLILFYLYLKSLGIFK